MNKNNTDIWTFGHFILGIYLTIFFVTKGLSLLFTIGLIVFFELLEHLIVGDLLFKWDERDNREIPRNAIYDIIFGLLGILIALILFV